VIVAVQMQDVAAHLLEQRALRHLEHLRDLQPRERGGAGAQEERRGLAVEHEVADRGGGEPVARAEALHDVMEARALEVGGEVVELGQIEVCNEAHER
jgi:hypothetical protein